MIYNVVLVSGVQQSESVIHIQYIYSFSDSFPIEVITEYRAEFPVLYSRSLLGIYFIQSSVCTFTPRSTKLWVGGKGCSSLSERPAQEMESLNDSHVL